jgi:hypothetical protein
METNHSFPKWRTAMHHHTLIYTIPCLILCAALSIINSGCGEKNAHFSPSVELPATDTSSTETTTTDTTATDTTSGNTVITLSAPITLEWDAPTTYMDDSRLDPTKDIQEYRIYVTTQSGIYSPGNYYPVPAPAESITITEINSQINSQAEGTYYFVVTAVDRTNVESYYSNEVQREVN